MTIITAIIDDLMSMVGMEWRLLDIISTLYNKGTVLGRNEAFLKCCIDL